MSRFIDHIRQQMVDMEYKPETIQVYTRWIARFIRFHNLRHPATMGQSEAQAYIEYLAIRRRVSSSTQNQAVGSLMFLYNEILDQSINLVGYRAKMHHRIPETASKREIMRVLENLTGRERLMALLIYGAGLKLSECAKLRLSDIDFCNRMIIVNHRETILPEKLIDDLAFQIELARNWPGNIDEYIFPSSRMHGNRCWHVSPASLQKALKASCLDYKRITPHTLRNSFGQHLIEAGYNVRIVQDLLGHASVKTTLKLQPMSRVISPADELEKYAEKTA